MSKGFRRPQAEPTKSELISGQGEALKALASQLQGTMNMQVNLHRKLGALENDLNAFGSVLRKSVKEGTIEGGDSVLLDFIGFLYREDGTLEEEHFHGGFGLGQVILNVGAYAFLKEFEDALVGQKAGAQLTIELTFPAEYHAEQFKGKKAQFRIAILGVWAADPVSAFVTEAYEASIKAQAVRLEAQKKAVEETAALNAPQAGTDAATPTETPAQ